MFFFFFCEGISCAVGLLSIRENRFCIFNVDNLRVILFCLLYFSSIAMSDLFFKEN